MSDPMVQAIARQYESALAALGLTDIVRVAGVTRTGPSGFDVDLSILRTEDTDVAGVAAAIHTFVAAWCPGQEMTTEENHDEEQPMEDVEWFRDLLSNSEEKPE